MPPAQTSNPNDFKVVKFTNSTAFDFTPALGCMFDGRPIFGTAGGVGIIAGESMVLPYHIAHRLATNLAKMVQIKRAPTVDEPNNPVGKPLWNDEELEKLKNSFLEELYSESKPIAQSETERLLAKVEEYRGMVDELLKRGVPAQPVAQATPAPAPVTEAPVAPPVTPSPESAPTPPGDVAPTPPVDFKDKQEVIAELEKRGIKHDKRKSKADLEKLLA